MKNFSLLILGFEQIIKNILILLIKLYQKTISFDHGLLKIFHPYGHCRFHPTCSEYAVQSLKKYRLFKALFKSAWRVLRCNPWSKGGIDPA